MTRIRKTDMSFISDLTIFPIFEASVALVCYRIVLLRLPILILVMIRLLLKY